MSNGVANYGTNDNISFVFEENSISSDSDNETTPLPSHDKKNRIRLLILMFALNLLVNYDSGAIASDLLQISKDLNLNYTQQGLLGSLQYLGLIFTSFIAGWILQRPNCKWVICVSMMINTGFDLLFALSRTWTNVIIARIGVGMSQVFLVIYTPVWVDDYAPATQRTMWMSIIQTSVPLGIMSGYFFAGLIFRYTNYNYHVSFIAQVVLLVPFVTLLWFFPSRYFENKNFDQRNAPEEQNALLSNVKYSNVIAVPHLATMVKAKVLDATSPVRIGLSIFPPSKSNGKYVIDHRQGEYVFVLDKKNRLGISLNGVWVHFGTFATGDEFKVVTRNEKIYMYHSGVLLQTFSFIKGPLYTIMTPNKRHTCVKDIEIDLFQANYIDQCKLLFRSPIYLWTVLGLCSLYFVITGLQFWVTKYLFHIKKNYALILFFFTLTSITAPISGVVVGGTMMDSWGGYRGTNGIRIASKLSFVFAFFALCSAIPVMFGENFWLVGVMIWWLIFFGAGMVPPATGILLASIPPSMRSFGLSIAQIFNNCFGYFAGPFIPGVIMEVSGEMHYGWYFCISISGVGFIAMMACWRAAQKDYDRRKIIMKNWENKNQQSRITNSESFERIPSELSLQEYDSKNIILQAISRSRHHLFLNPSSSLRTNII